MSSHGTAAAQAAPPGYPGSGSTSGVDRRQFLRGTMFGTVGVLMGSMPGGGTAMIWPVKVSGFGSTVPVPKALSELKSGDPPLQVHEGKFWLSRLEDGMMALYWRCPHLGCTVPWNETEGQFHCPCHESIYNRTGQNVAGPAPRPLDCMEVQILGDQILVNTGKITQRAMHEPQHVTKT